jgi:predicted Zn-dependent protease with MMP-like domain
MKTSLSRIDNPSRLRIAKACMATLYALVIGRHAVLIPDSLRASVSEVSLAVADFAASHLIDALTAALLGLFFVWWFIITF